MSMLKLVLDTNVFATRAWFEWLLEHREVKAFLPCLAYLELVYHHLGRGKDASYVDGFLELHGIEVVPVGMGIARRAAESAAGRWDFREKASDYVIGATAIELGAQLVTYNKRDFSWMPSDSVLSPEQVYGVSREGS